MPDMVLAAHAHNYQRFTRFVSFGGMNIQIPLYVAGCGGRRTIAVRQADGIRVGDHSFDGLLEGFGYLTVSSSPQRLTLFLTQAYQAGARRPFDKKSETV